MEDESDVCSRMQPPSTWQNLIVVLCLHDLYLCPFRYSQCKSFSITTSITVIGLHILSQRSVQRSLWLRKLREHLNSDLVPILTSLGITVSPHILQESVIVTLTSHTLPPHHPVGTHSAMPYTSPVKHLLPVESEVVSVERLKSLKSSFQVCLRSVGNAKATRNNGRGTYN